MSDSLESTDAGRSTDADQLTGASQPNNADQSTDAVRASTSSVSADAPTDLTIGTYHPKAGSRNAGGVSTYVREQLAALPASCDAYLYTEPGSSGSSLDGPAEVVEISPRIDGAAERVPLSVAAGVPIQDALESVECFANAVLAGVVGHANREVDVLFAHGEIDAVLLSNAVDVPVVRVYHGVQRTGRAAAVLGRLSDVDAAVANSRLTARGLEERLGHDVAGVVWPGVDVDAFSPRATPAFERDDPVVLFVGRFTEAKGVFDLLEAFASIDAADAELVLVGRGDEECAEERASELGVRDAVTLAGVVPHERLPGYYTASDVFCLPSHRESFGLVALEAMACGTPTVTTDLPGIRAFATDGESASLVEPGDVEAIGASLETLLADPALRDRYAEAGRSAAEAFSWRQSADELLAVAERVVEVGG